MDIETIGDLWTYGAKIYARCMKPRREGLKSVPACLGRQDLDLSTMLWTHGADYPVSRLSHRLKCSRCGCREVSVHISLPTETLQARAMREMRR